jgi:protein SCO1/2
MAMRASDWLFALLLIICAGPLAAHEKPAASVPGQEAKPGFGLDQAAALDASQAVVGKLPGDYTLLDSAGQPVSLSRFRGKPLLVNFVYTGCFDVCPTSSVALYKAVDAMRDRFGFDQFEVATIGFNQPVDSPLAMRDFAARLRIKDPNWAFLSPRAQDVAALTRDFGFSYVATPMGFDHTLQVTIVDADGRIFRQIYGEAFAADSLGEPLKQLLTGSLSTGSVISRSSGLKDLIGKVRILCSVYDPLTGKYRVDYSLYLEIAGGLTFILTLLVLAIQEWRGRRALLHPQVQ